MRGRKREEYELHHQVALVRMSLSSEHYVIVCVIYSNILRHTSYVI